MLVRVWVLSCLVASLQVGVSAAQGPAGLSVMVAPFERIGPPGTTGPDSALLLADRLGTRGVGRVVGPAQMGLQPLASPSDEMVKSWASAANVGLVITGSSTRIGKRTSLDLRVHSASTGAVVGTYVGEAAQPEDLEIAIDRLAEQIVAGSVAAAPAATPPVAAAPADSTSDADEGGSAAPVPKSDDGGGSSSSFLGAGGGSSRNDQPISIRSDELEALQQGESRRFVFKRNVRAKQGDMVLTSRELEAYYPPGASHPEKLIATGTVKLTQQGKEAHCDKATYFRAQQKVICTGDTVELVQGADRVRGKEIEFYLDTDRLLVRGGADVFLESGEPAGGSGGGSAPASATPVPATPPAQAAPAPEEARP
jgi:lipopolysaccharide transport protein LptA